MFPIVIGHLVLSTAREVVQHYETAAWETVIVAEPGRYPVIAYGPDVDHVYVRFTGKVVRSYLPSLLGGVPFGGNRYGDEKVGTTMEVAERLSPTTRTGQDIYSAVLRSDIEWDASRMAQNPTLPWRIQVRGARPEELTFPVESVSCHRVNTGSPTEFWQVVVTARTVNPATSEGAGWVAGYTGGGGGGGTIYRASQSFRHRECWERKMPETQARALVAKIQAAGTICPARWQTSGWC